LKSYENPIEKSFSDAEDQTTPEPSVQSTVSFKTVIDVTITDLTLSITNWISFEAFRNNRFSEETQNGGRR